MTKRECFEQLAELHRITNLARENIICSFLDKQNTYKVGDIYSDDLGAIIITEVTYVPDLFAMSYTGIILDENDKNSAEKLEYRKVLHRF